MSFFLAFLWLAEFTCALTFVGLGFKAVEGAMENPLPGVLQGCFTSEPADFRMVLRSGGVSSGFQAVYLAITMFKLSKFVKAFGFQMTPLLQVFFRDGAGYCFMILAVYILNTFLERFGPISLQGTGESWLIVTVSITACRMVLNIRDIVAPSEIMSKAAAGQTELQSMKFWEGRNNEQANTATTALPM